MSKWNKTQAVRLKQLCEAVGAFIEYWGFKRVHGEIWMFVYATDHPVAAQEIQDFFGLSRALVHLVLGELISYGLISRVKAKGIRKYHFQVTEDVWQCISRVLSSRERRLIETARDSVEAFETSLGRQASAVLERRIRFLRHLCNYTLHGLNLLIQGSMIPGRVEENISKLWKRFQAIKPFGKRSFRWPPLPIHRTPPSDSDYPHPMA